MTILTKSKANTQGAEHKAQMDSDDIKTDAVSFDVDLEGDGAKYAGEGKLEDNGVKKTGDGNLEDEKVSDAGDGKMLKENGKSVDSSTENSRPDVGAADENRTPEEDPVKIMQEELSVERDKYLRLAAEYDNYRKRSVKEREMIYADARVNVVSKLLPVYDNLERALCMECADDAYFKGVEMIMAQLTETLSDIGVREITAVGELFDPNRHNAVMTIEDPDLGENIISEVYQKGFILGDRVIRFSTVVVANSK